MAKILNLLNVRKTLLAKGILIFTPQELVRIFGVSAIAATFFVHRHTRKGSLVRLKKSQRGSLYAFDDHLPSQYAIANRLYEPSYISFDTALAFHQVIPETVYAVTSATTQTTREFHVADVRYHYFRIKKQLYTGYRPLAYQDQVILMAEPEKALADYIYFLDLGKRSGSYERLDLSPNKINRKKLRLYVKMVQRPGMLLTVESLYADFRKSSRIR